MVLRLLSPQFLVLWAFIGSTLAVHFRGKVRLGFWRQFTDHSTLMAPYNVLMYMFSAVPNRPILEEKSFPEMNVLRDNWQTIREEAVDLFAQGQIKAADKYNDWGFNSFFRTGWKRFYLKWYDEPLPSALANCPKTVALLSSIPNIKGAMFTNLPPGGRLVQHRDPFAGSIRYHLGLQVPKSPGECRIFIDGDPHTWHDGEALLFDDLSALCGEHHLRRPPDPVLRHRATADEQGDDISQSLVLQPHHQRKRDAERRGRAGRLDQPRLRLRLPGAAARQAHEGLEQAHLLRREVCADRRHPGVVPGDRVRLSPRPSFRGAWNRRSGACCAKLLDV